MGSASDPIVSVLKFITGETIGMCRLCFDATNNSALSVEDNAKLESPFFEGFVTYAEMLFYLGVIEEPLMPLQLCPKCAAIITDAFIFQHLVQYSNTKWQDALKKMNSTLDLLDSNQPQYAAQTLHFVMKDNESQMFTSRRKLKSKQEVLLKLKNFESQHKFHKKPPKKPQSTFICEECGERFNSNRKLSKHMIRHAGKMYKCIECLKRFKTIWSLRDHKDSQHSPKKIQCSKCSKMVSTERLLRKHEDRDHKATICKLCHTHFPSKNTLLRHMNVHSKFQCPICDKTYINKQSFQVHVKLCGKLEPDQKVVCDICKQEYIRKNTLRTHLKLKHGFGREIYSCDWCSKKFDAASRLKNHIVTHTKEKNYHCDKCGGMFVTQAALVYHIRLHTGEKPFKCDLCDETFISASRKMEHKRRKHLGPQKQCPFCERKFFNGHSLRTHVARHQNPQSKLFLGD